VLIRSDTQQYIAVPGECVFMRKERAVQVRVCVVFNRNDTQERMVETTRL
jgi:hypothetical protein